MYSIIVPAYNEERRIHAALEKLSHELSVNYEIIVIAEGNDRTAEIASSFKNVTVLTFPKRLGKGGAIIEGVKVSKNPIIIFCDVDYGTQDVSISDLVKDLKDVNVGCRYSSIKIEGSFRRKLLSRLFNILVNLLFNLGLKDTQCGFKAFRRDVLLSVINQVKIRGFAFDVELLWRIKNKGYQIKEVPIKWDYTKETSVNIFKTSFEMLKDLIKLKFNLF